MFYRNSSESVSSTLYTWCTHLSESASHIAYEGLKEVNYDPTQTS